MVITVVLRVPDVPLSSLLAIAEPGLAGVAEAVGFGPLAPLVARAICREAERRFEPRTAAYTPPGSTRGAAAAAAVPSAEDAATIPHAKGPRGVQPKN